MDKMKKQKGLSILSLQVSHFPKQISGSNQPATSAHSKTWSKKLKKNNQLQ